jgi:ABC-type antimicrobial peptide transport system permease subunit
MLRSEGDPMRLASSVRDIVREVEPLAPITDMTTQETLLEERIHPERLIARFYTLFGGLALLLAAIGLFGLMSYNVTRRTREIGVRMALGARRMNVLSQVIRESLILALIGSVLGGFAAFGASRLIASQLFEIPPFHLPTLAIVIAAMLLVSTAAAFLPARRASRVDPLHALRHD